MEKVALETPRTHHSRWRTSSKERRLQKVKSWTTWTGLKGTLTVGQGEKRSQIVGGEVEGTGGENWYSGG